LKYFGIATFSNNGGRVDDDVSSGTELLHVVAIRDILNENFDLRFVGLERSRIRHIEASHLCTKRQASSREVSADKSTHSCNGHSFSGNVEWHGDSFCDSAVVS